MRDFLLSGEVITRALMRRSVGPLHVDEAHPRKACDMAGADMRTCCVLTKTTAKTNNNNKDVPWNQTHEASDSSLIAILILLVQAFRCLPVADRFLKSRILKCHTPEVHVSVVTCVSHLVWSFS